MKSFNKFIIKVALVMYATNSFSQVKVNSTGNVGIGILSPSNKLHVETNDFPVLVKTTGTGSFMTAISGQSPNITADQSTNIEIGRNRSQNNIGKLMFYYKGSGLTTNFLSLGFFGNDFLFNVQATGRVGIGTTNPGYQLTLSQNSAAKPISSTWTVSSDSRVKTDIVRYTKGLDIIRKIELVSYKYNGLGGTTEGESGIGVIAQDFLKVMPTAVKPYGISEKSNGRTENYLGVDFHELFMVYLNAIKELDNQNTELRMQVNKLQTEVNKLSGNKNLTTDTSLSQNTPKLFQNKPNPFNQQTTIDYYLPTQAKTAMLMMFDLQGKLVKTINLVATGNASIAIQANELNAGMYIYSLVVDGQEIDSKRMIMTE